MVRNIVAVVLGLVVGSIVNMAIVTIGPNVVPLPAGVDQSTMENFSHTVHLLEPKHFIAPFLAHALGTLVGAIVAFKLAASHQFGIAMGIGAAFFAGGLTMALIVPSPAWFITLDLVVAYFPMAWLATRLAGSSGSGGSGEATAAESSAD